MFLLKWTWGKSKDVHSSRTRHIGWMEETQASTDANSNEAIKVPELVPIPTEANIVTVTDVIPIEKYI